MKLEINYSTSAVSIPGAVIDRMGELSGTELATVLLMCSDSAFRCAPEDAALLIAERLGIGTGEAEHAINTLRGMGIVSAGRTARRVAMPKKTLQVGVGDSTPRPFEDTQQRVAVMPISMPEYTGEQIADMIDKTPLYKVIIDETQRICGTMFTPTEVSRVLSLADYLKLDFEHILMLFTYCKNKGKTSVQYAVKTAFTLYNQGIDTRAAFEEYVKKSEEFDTVAGQVRALFGLGERAFTAKEKEYIAAWCREAIPFDMIEHAYEITVTNTGKASLAYANKILMNWCDSGYRTLSDVQQAEGEYRKAKGQSTSFKTDEFFEAALRRGREKMGEG